jgi:ABC-type antimicrobial peptide transport system permease subunit
MGLGILVAVILICTVPLYSSLVSNVALQQALRLQLPPSVNIETAATLNPATKSSIGKVLDQTRSSANQLLGRFAPTSTWYLRVEYNFPPVEIDQRLLPDPRYSLPPSPVLMPYAFNLPAALPHMRLLSGRLPKLTSSGQLPEILVTTNMVGVKLGDTISISYHALTFKVVGFWTPKNVSDPYWNGGGSEFDSEAPPCARNCPPTVLPVLFAQNTFFNLFGSNPASSLQALYGISVHYIAFTTPSRITVGNTPATINAISTYRSTLNGALYGSFGVVSIAVGTRLDSVLAGEQRQFGLLAQPLYIVIIQLVGLALLFVVAMASLLIENQAIDIATLRSRGASRAQLLLNYCLQGLVVAVAAGLAGPFLAAGLSLLIVQFFVPSAVAVLHQQAHSGGGSLAQLVAPDLVLVPALAGALLGLLALLAAAWLAGRRDVLALRRQTGRQEQAPVWQRAYLDLGLVVLAVAGYLELGEFGVLNVRQQLGRGPGGADPLELVAPALLLLAGALVALRLFPLATRAGAWLAQRGRGVISMLAFAELERTRGQFARPALLLTLAIGLAIFALTFQASLKSNSLAEAQFLVGCDQRVVLQDAVPGMPITAPLEARIAATPGVEAITPVYRSVATNLSDNANVDLLAIDPTSFARVAYWRSDYASQPLSTLMAKMESKVRGPDAGDQSHPIWALVDAQFAGQYALSPGVVFALAPNDSPFSVFYFVVGAVVAHYPTLGDTAVNGHVVFSLADYANALNGSQGRGYIYFNGPNEYWLRTIPGAAAASQRAAALTTNPNLWVQSVISLTTMEQQALDDPLSAGMAGLLEVGAISAALLALVGSMIQASSVARQRVMLFAILRTLGGRRQQLLGILLTQQAIVYGFGLVAGTLLGIVLSTATLPFLTFSTAVLDAASQQLPPSLLAMDTRTIAGFYAAMLLTFAAALIIGTQAVLRGGLGQTLRIGED